MVIYCSAYGCSNGQGEIQTTFHRFPFKRPDILRLWVNAMRREGWYPTKTSRICGEHFLPTDFLPNLGSYSKKLLKPDAVPSTFNFPKHLRKIVVPRKQPARANLDKDTEATIVDPNLPSSLAECCKKSVDRETQTIVQTRLENKLLMLKRRVRTFKQKIKRRDLKILSMKDVIKEISQSGYSNANLDNVMKNYFEGLPLELVLLQKSNIEIKHPTQHRYSPLMKQFAHTLYYYSPKAYQFLKQYFTLPNGRTIRKWLQSVNCEPGVLQEVLEFLKQEVKKKSSLKNCALIVDGMSIRKQVIWDDSKGKLTGNVNYGDIIDVDFEMAASEALFIQVVSLSTNFKCPVAYFLINKTDANIQSQLITTCLRSLYDSGIIVRSITADGAQTNIATFKNLGISLGTNEIVPYFFHPCKSDVKVHCILDPCHMLKLARNAFAEKNITSDLGKVSWGYIRDLDNIQRKEGLRLANSLTSSHVNFRNKVMNVKLAAQSISSGVADAIEFLDKSDTKEFKNSSATVEFIRNVDRIFDILNSRNPYGKGFKAPIRPSTLKYFEEIFLDTEKYLKSLKIDNIDILQHNRKTFALGFMLTMKSTLSLVKDLFSLSKEPFKYFLTYKYSQDHLELFFSCIRSRGGWNNNPNSQQLKWALRQLLFRNSITSSIHANCSEFGEYCTPAFEFRSEERKQTIAINENDSEEIQEIIKYLDRKQLNNFQENVIFYISGYIVRSLVNTSTCSHCIDILLYKNRNSLSDHEYHASNESFKRFTNCISRGGLLHASDIVYKIVNFLERQIRYLFDEGNMLKNKTNIKKVVVNRAIKYFSAKLNYFMPVHPTIQEFLAEELHEIQILRKISNMFLKCRMHHFTRLKNFELHGQSATVRQKMSKLILFKNC